jgi:hypothetical protein
MPNRSALLALVDEAARDPSAARRLLELAATMLRNEAQRGAYAEPPGYIYAGAHTWIATFENLPPEPLPTAADPVPGRLPLTNTANAAQVVEVPFDALILGVSGWAASEIDETRALDDTEGILLMSSNPEGRDLFAVEWNLNARLYYSTDGKNNLLEPAAAVLGTRTRPRPLGWLVQRNDEINVRCRNTTNVAVPFAFYDQQPEPYGWPITVEVGFHVLNLERP